ncbi:hypothetical protein AB4Y42_34370 [Paraburkholderia sp. EG286B]|uniref:hypothetical protein n=1 Tax=Paraburkholderia sp. EG286B TaxID=3237011 RepID=UPI0034D34594
MDRIIAANSVPMAQADTAPTTGTPQGATDGNPATNVPATRWPSYQYNAIQEELIAILTAAGVIPDRTNNAQIAAALRRIVQTTTVLTDTGTANAYAAVNATPLVAGTWGDGIVQAVKIAHANTGPSTYAPDGLAAIPIYGLGLLPLQGAELFVGGTAILMHATIAGVNGGSPICVLMECAGGAQQVPPATQPAHAAQLQQVGDGQCRLTVANSTSATLIPFNGNNLVINGVPQQIPAAGVSVSNSGLAASTDYYVYAQMVSGSMVLNLSTTGYTRQSNGIFTKTGDATQRFVGMVGTNAASQFQDDATTRLCCSFFNRFLKAINIGSFNGTSTSTTLVSTGKTFIGMYLAGDAINARLTGYGSVNVSGGQGSMTLQADSATNSGTLSWVFSPSANSNASIASEIAANATDGRHTATAYVACNSGNTITYQCDIMGQILQ